MMESECYVNRADIMRIYGMTFSMVKRRLKADDEYYPASAVRAAIASYEAEGWRPGTKKCAECGKWLEKKKFNIMESRCKFCESKAIEARHGRG